MNAVVKWRTRAVAGWEDGSNKTTSKGLLSMDTYSWRESDDFDRVVGMRSMLASFQPIVDLDTEDVVAYEALTRPPPDSQFQTFDEIAREARHRGRMGELDWVCRAAVFRAVIENKPPSEMALFVNVEPDALSAPCPPDIVYLVSQALHQCRFVVEVTERLIADDPNALLAAVVRTREASIGVALDDVGARPESLALLPLIAPDVIKLDLALVQAQSGPEIARIMNAVSLEAERTGALIVAEGVENERHLAFARSIGATFGQGWLFGRPGPLPDVIPAPYRPFVMSRPPEVPAETPFQVIAAKVPPRRLTRQTLAHVSPYLEYEVANSSGKAVLLAAFETVENFVPSVRRRYRELESSTVLTAVMGTEMPADVGRGVRGVELGKDDPLAKEWVIVVLGTEESVALAATHLPATHEDDEELFSAVITHDRDLVVAAARSMCWRLPPKA